MNTLAERLTAKGSPFEIVEATVGGVPCKIFRHAPGTLLDVYRKARLCRDREFLITGSRSVSYRQLFQMAARIARIIREKLGRTAAAGTRIALILDNGPEWMAAFVAITSIGSTAVAIHRASSLPDTIAAIATTDSGLVICAEEMADALTRYGCRIPLAVIATAGESLESLPATTAGAAPEPQELTLAAADTVQPEHLAMIALTSGSTNQPKGVELTHRSMVCGMMNALLGGALASTKAAGGPVPSAKPLPPAPFLAAAFSHVSGYGTLLLTMYVGGKIVTVEKWDPKGVVNLMLSQRATALIGATAEMLRELLQQADVAKLSDIRSIVAQGTALPQSLLHALKSALPAVSIGAGYGLTETNGSVCMGSETMLRERPNTSGRPLPSVELKIRRDDAREAEPGEIGEVIIRGAMLMRGYTNLPDATAKALQDGWLRTGDLGRLDAEGFLYLTDRADHFVVYGGTQVSCAALEQVVVEQKLAAEAAAFAIQQDDQEEKLVLAISSSTQISSDDAAIMTALRSAGYGPVVPLIVRLNTPLPRTPSGKIDRRELRRRILA